MAELNDRIALVYQDKGDFAKAVEYFSKTLELNQQAGGKSSVAFAFSSKYRQQFIFLERGKDRAGHKSP